MKIAVRFAANSQTNRPLFKNLREHIKINKMELEMFLNGKFIDSITITEKDIERIHELQHKLEKKHCHQLEYSDGQPQFFISGLSDEDVPL